MELCGSANDGAVFHDRRIAGLGEMHEVGVDGTGIVDSGWEEARDDYRLHFAGELTHR